MFLGFANFYCQFIEVFGKVASDLLNMLKNSTKKKFKGMKFVFTGKALESFNELKYFFAVKRDKSMIQQDGGQDGTRITIVVFLVDII